VLDFADKDFLVDPYPALAEARAVGKPFWHEPTGMFLAARHADANAVLRNKSLGRIFTPKTPENEWHAFNYLHSDSILDSEPPKHTRLKSLVSKAFNPRTINSLTPHIERLTTELLDDCADKREQNGTFDVLVDFAEPLPVKVIAHMLGFPDTDEHLLRPWSQSMATGAQCLTTEPTQPIALRQLTAQARAPSPPTARFRRWPTAQARAPVRL
jgi:cytochrome P450